MALPQLDGIDLDGVLAPLPGEPTGIDLREDFSPESVYFRLRDARAGARDLERQSETASGETVMPAQWREVRSLALQALATRSKDLEVACWLTEALVRTDGLPGLAVGAELVGGLLERYWDGLYPMPDEDGIETRVAPLGGLSGQGYDGTLLQPLRRLTLFTRPDGAPFAFWQYESTLELAAITDPTRRAQRIEAGTVAFEDVEKEARFAGPPHWAARSRDIDVALSAWSAMAERLDRKAGADSPSTSRVRDLLGAMAELCRRFAPAGNAGDVADDVPTGAGSPGASVATGDGLSVATPATPGAIGGREQALRQLGDIAAWFRRNEPHSPLAYTLDEAVRRGRMTWPELLDELIPDETSRHALLTSLGIKPVTGDGT